MNISQAVIAIAKIAVDQRQQLAALTARTAAQDATIAELAARVQAAESAASIALPDELAALVGTAGGTDEVGTVAPPAIL